jgi:hypothetical protein
MAKPTPMGGCLVRHTLIMAHARGGGYPTRGVGRASWAPDLARLRWDMPWSRDVGAQASHGAHCVSLSRSSHQGRRFWESGVGGLGGWLALGGTEGRAALAASRRSAQALLRCRSRRRRLGCAAAVGQQTDLGRHPSLRAGKVQIPGRLQQQRVQHRAEGCRKPGRVVGLQARRDGSLRGDGSQRPTQCGTSVDRTHNGQAERQPGDCRPTAAPPPTSSSVCLPGTCADGAASCCRRAAVVSSVQRRQRD